MAPNQSNRSNSLTTATPTPEGVDDEPPNRCQNGLIDDHSMFDEDVLLIEDLEAGAKSDHNSNNSTTTTTVDRLRKPKIIRRTTTQASISLPRSRPESSKFKDWAQLFVYAFAELVGGFTFSLLSPFYTKEATAKGLTVSETGLVYGSVFITTIIFSPIFGKYINSIGSRNLFLYGTFLAGSTNVLFGFLQYVNGSKTFFILSLAVRIVSAVGESAFFCAIYPLAAEAAPIRYRSTVLSIMETMFGVGLMIGPFFGSVLYELDGFYLPFVVCGTALAVCPIVAIFCIGGTNGTEPDDDSEKTPFFKLAKMPCIFFSCLILCLAQSSVAWYLPSLQPFLEDTFQLTTVATGAMFTVEGATYAAFSPLWGWLLDKWVSPWVALYTGTICVIIGYCLLGPSPFLPFIPENIYVVGFALSIMGFGVAATFITTLTFMLSESVRHGAPDNEQTRGIVTSLWFISENLGGYIGASLGGFTFDKIGFVDGTTVVIGMQVVALLAIPLMWKLNKNQKSVRLTSRSSQQLSVEDVTERTKLIDHSNNSNNNDDNNIRNGRYKSTETA